MRLFVLCPAAHATGGPEALHQLVHKAGGLGFDAAIVYRPENHPRPTAGRYVPYGVPVSRQWVDAPDSLVVTPEIDVPELATLTHARRGLWWLSVDNFTIRDELLRRRAGTAVGPLDGVYRSGDAIVHLAQSQYAADHLRARGCSSLPLTDYLHAELIARLTEHRTSPKDLVVYNPAKGMDVTAALMDLAPHLPWTPLAGLAPDDVVDVLGRARVYVDFGHHPGRDRMPREAVVAGACVLVGERGSAGNGVDVPVPAGFRFDDGPAARARVVARIEECLRLGQEAAAPFAPYRRWVEQQEATFTDEVFALLATVDAGMRAREVHRA